MLKALLLTIVWTNTAFAVESGKLSRTYDQADDTYWAKLHIQKNDAVIGIVEKISGDAFLKRKGKTRKESASYGFHLYEGDSFGTEEGRIHVRVKDGTYIELAEKGLVQVERVRLKYQHKDESVYRFTQGVARFVNAELGMFNQYTVKTSNAILRVRSASEFYLVQPDEIRDLTVAYYRGKGRLMCAVTNDDISIKAGQAAFLKVSGIASPAGNLTQDLVTFLKDRTRL